MNRGIITPLDIARPAGFGANGAAMSGVAGRMFDAQYRDNTASMKDLPNAVTKLFTVPSGFQTQINFTAYNTTGSSITVSTFLADPSQTSVATADRWVNTAVAANTFLQGSTDAWLTEGWSYWAMASAATGLNIFPAPFTVPALSQTGAGGLFTPIIVKSAPTIETLLYQCCTPEAVAMGATGGAVHNTTGGSLTYTVKLKRAGDPASFIISVQTVAANGQASWIAGNGAALCLYPGDAIYHLASGPGINVSAAYIERQARGRAPFEPFGLHAS